MKAYKCSNGHWYDAELYIYCPQCGEARKIDAADPDNAPPHDAPKKKSFGIFKKIKKHHDGDESRESNANNENVVPPNGGIPVSNIPAAEDIAPQTGGENVYIPPHTSCDGHSHTMTDTSSDVPVSTTHEDVTERFFSDLDDERTVSMFELQGIGQGAEAEPAGTNSGESAAPADLSTPPTASGYNDAEGGAEDAPEGIVVGSEDIPVPAPAPEPAPAPAPVPVPAPEPAPAPAPVSTPTPAPESLSAELRRVSAMDDGKTLSYFNAMIAPTNTAPAAPDTSVSAAAKVPNPTVGWLVAISGVHVGDSFAIHTGKNTIGRNSTNKIALELDRSVSREKHAIIIYEPKKREFYLQPGTSDGLTYLNDEFLTALQPMKEKDVMEIGSTKLILIPLCGPDFSWEEYMRRD